MPESKDADIKKALQDFWDEQMGEGLGEPSPFPVDSGLDSVTATHVICEIEKLLGVKDIPQTVVRRGGYENRDDFVNSLHESLNKHLSADAAHPGVSHEHG